MFKVFHDKRKLCFALSIFLLLIAKIPDFAAADGKIVFSYREALWTINPDGTNQRALGIQGNFPSWSPDESQIAFTVYHRGDKMQGKNSFTKTFIINADGSDRRLLMSTQHLQWRSDGLPVWSPEGNRIAFF